MPRCRVAGIAQFAGKACKEPGLAGQPASSATWHDASATHRRHNRIRPPGSPVGILTHPFRLVLSIQNTGASSHDRTGRVSATVSPERTGNQPLCTNVRDQSTLEARIGKSHGRSHSTVPTPGLRGWLDGLSLGCPVRTTHSKSSQRDLVVSALPHKGASIDDRI